MSSVKQQRGLLLLALLLCVHGDRDCSLEDFKAGSLFDSNFQLGGLSQTYSSGQSLRVYCKVGFRGFFKLICQDGTWAHMGDRCRVVSCGHPGDVLFADFSLVTGDDFVFGSQVLYSCHSGYQMISRINTRNCLEDGWDGHLPVCEALLCPVLDVDPKVSVNGNVEQATAGSVVLFGCRERGDELVGPAQIECNDMGSWSHAPPICRDISCPVPSLEHFQVNNQKAVYRENSVLRYSCDSGYRKKDGRPALCLKQGWSVPAQWTPFPECEMITCELPRPLPDGTVFTPQDKFRFNVNEKVQVKCSDNRWVKNVQLQATELSCSETGDWDYSPACQLVQCDKTGENICRWGWGMSWRNQLDLSETISYTCCNKYEKTSEVATCTRQGWKPDHLCIEKRCSKPTFKNTDITDHPEVEKYPHNFRLNMKCRYDVTVFAINCYYGNWMGQIPCKEKPCDEDPVIRNGEMVEASRALYEHGQTVLFRCAGEQRTFVVSCQSGTWSSHRTCKAHKDCGPAPFIPHLNMTYERQSFSHGDTLPLQCESGYTAQPEELTCNEGSWTSAGVDHEHICTTNLKTCGVPHKRENVLILAPVKKEYSSGTVLKYRCRDGFTMEGNPNYSCENGVWDQHDIHCIAPSVAP